VDYVDAPVQQGSGAPVEVRGGSFLQGTLSGRALPTETDLTELPVAPVPGGAPTEVAGRAATRPSQRPARPRSRRVGDARPVPTLPVPDPPRLVVAIGRCARGRARPGRLPPVRGHSYPPPTVQRPDSAPSAQPGNSAADRSGATCIRARGPRGSPPGPSSHQ